MDGVTDACCPLCCQEDEDIVHMLIHCPSLSVVCTAYINDLKYPILAGVGLVDKTLILWYN